MSLHVDQAAPADVTDTMYWTLRTVFNIGGAGKTDPGALREEIQRIWETSDSHYRYAMDGSTNPTPTQVMIRAYVDRVVNYLKREHATRIQETWMSTRASQILSRTNEPFNMGHIKAVYALRNADRQVPDVSVRNMTISDHIMDCARVSGGGMRDGIIDVLDNPNNVNLPGTLQSLSVDLNQLANEDLELVMYYYDHARKRAHARDSSSGRYPNDWSNRGAEAAKTIANDTARGTKSTGIGDLVKTTDVGHNGHYQPLMRQRVLNMIAGLEAYVSTYLQSAEDILQTRIVNDQEIRLVTRRGSSINLTRNDACTTYLADDVTIPGQTPTFEHRTFDAPPGNRGDGPLLMDTLKMALDKHGYAVYYDVGPHRPGFVRSLTDHGFTESRVQRGVMFRLPRTGL